MSMCFSQETFTGRTQLGGALRHTACRLDLMAQDQALSRQTVGLQQSLAKGLLLEQLITAQKGKWAFGHFKPIYLDYNL